MSHRIAPRVASSVACLVLAVSVLASTVTVAHPFPVAGTDPEPTLEPAPASIGLAPPAREATPGPFARHPAVSPDGRTVAFSHQGDIWTVPVEGGRAARLTIHEAYEGSPRFSPDGRHIAFVSDRFGNDDVWIIGVDGDSPRRLTHHSADDEEPSWTPDGRLLFQTERTWVQVEREGEIHSVSIEGGTPTRLLDAVAFTPTMSPDGRFIAFAHGSNRERRKGYRGTAAKEIWLYDTERDEYRQLTTFDGNDFRPRWGDPRTLFFLSERDGTTNVYRLRLGAEGQSDAERLTRYAEDGPRRFDVSADGRTLVFERRTDLYALELDGGGDPREPRRLEIRVPADYRFDPVERKTFTDSASEFAVSPDGDAIAFVVRGELFVTRNEPEEIRTRRLTRHPWRDRDAAWLDETRLVFASDREGRYDLYRLESADPDQPEPLWSLEHRVSRLTETADRDERAPVVSPDGEKVAFIRDRGTLVVADVVDGKLTGERVLLDGWDTPTGVSWSPDSRWLAYSLDDLDFNAEIYIQAADGSGDPVNFTRHPKNDVSPIWSRDGSRIGFLSERNNGDLDLWFVWLRKEDWEKTEEDWELEKEMPPKDPGKGKGKKGAANGSDRDDGADEGGDDEPEPEVEPVRIDFDRIHERLQQVTSLPGNETDLALSHDGETFYFVANRAFRRRFDAPQDLHAVRWDGTGLTALTRGDTDPAGVVLGPEGQHLYMTRSGGRLARIAAPDLSEDGNGNHGASGDKAAGKLEALPFSARMAIDHREEAQQVFDEAWRVLEQGFYDPDFHGNDWESLRDKYRPWALKASTKRDFRDAFNLMLGELNASHLGLYGPDRAETQEERTGLLGVEIEPASGETVGVRVVRVVPDSPADREVSRLSVGDVITAVDGEPIQPDGNFYALLADRVDERTVLTVGRDGESRQVVIRPAESLSRQLYREWVADRRELTDRYSDGRLGYIHVEGMNWPSFERFERELVAAGAGKEGIVIDVRFNGGGWTTDYLMAVLTVRQHAYTIPRGAARDLEEEKTRFRDHYPFGERLPLASWTRPAVALCNGSSFSNAEIFSHAFKTLGIGPLVGEPTFGAVISTGGAGLVDGSYVRLPFRGWFVRATDRNMENGPAVPDVIVPTLPHDRADGEDEQLRAAVDTLLEEIDEG